MTNRIIRFPQPALARGTDRAGLAEYLLQNVLNIPEALSSVAACELSLWLSPKLQALMGEKQEGASITLSQGQWETLCDWARPKQPVPWDLAHVVALVMKALLSAESVEDPLPPALSTPALETALKTTAAA